MPLSFSIMLIDDKILIKEEINAEWTKHFKQ